MSDGDTSKSLPWRPASARCWQCNGEGRIYSEGSYQLECLLCTKTGLTEIPWCEVQGVEWRTLKSGKTPWATSDAARCLKIRDKQSE